MTEKRFLYVLDNDEDTVYDLFEKNILSKKDIGDKMNALNDENEQLKKENYELKQKNRRLYKYCESQIRRIEFMEKVLENMGYSVVFDNEKQKWVIE